MSAPRFWLLRPRPEVGQRGRVARVIERITVVGFAGGVLCLAASGLGIRIPGTGPFFVGDLALVLVVSSICWALAAGGLALALQPALMAGSWMAELTRASGHPRLAGLVIAWTGASLGALLLASFVSPGMSDDILSWRLPAPLLLGSLLTLFGPLVALLLLDRGQPRAG
jgi:hypothetical protein